MIRWFLSLFLAFPLWIFCEEVEGVETVRTRHAIHLEGKELSYEAVAGRGPILRGGEEVGNLFFIGYHTGEERPVTFVLPGGPGGSGTLGSILALGPKRLRTKQEGGSICPPYELIENPETLLTETDLVFVDPPGCGYSDISDDEYEREFFDIEGDIHVLGEFIRHYVDLSQKWNCPIYLLGESYGTVRAAGIAFELLRYGIAVKGILLNGACLDFSNCVSERDKGMPDCLSIPTFAATAWYHERLWPEKSLEEVVDYARRFAFDEYAPFLLQPSRLNPIEKYFFEKRLAEITGLSEEIVRRYNCRINESIYTAEFFWPERKILGGIDTRYVGDIASIDPDFADDPSYLETLGAVAAFQHYLQKELEISYPLQNYHSFSSKANHYWDFRTYDSFGEPNLIQRLRRLFTLHPSMQVFVGAGYYDCRTPFAAAEYGFDHLDLPDSYRENIFFHYYEAGHGFIFDLPSLKKWKKDLSMFYQGKSKCGT